ncbi:MAG: leucyl aminopeptidase [Deltaproteobacteria bacterium]|nr:leucyl aminopeptidase [Deltaproteobacteria bacterium]
MITLKSADLSKEKMEVLVVPVCEDKQIHGDKQVNALVQQAKKLKEFTGESKQRVTFYATKGLNAERIVFMGLGKLADLTRDGLRCLAGKAVNDAMGGRLSSLHIAAPSGARMKWEAVDILEPLMEGSCLANHLFDKYKLEKKIKPLKRITILSRPENVRKHKKLLSRVSAVCNGTILAREWVNTPANDKRPEQFAKLIAAQATRNNLKVRVLDEKTLRKGKFGALMAVAIGSEQKPRMVVLEYRPAKARKTVVLVGKGVTFDSGGINLKPSAGLETMKTDMAGAAAVAGTLMAAAKFKPNCNLVGVLPIVENMPSGSATRPGDVVKSVSGKTVEIGNTDAEGRLILADALTWANNRYKPDVMVDVATLTGACVIALGDKIAGIFSKDDNLAQAILSAGEKTHERCWRLPMPDDYQELLKSEIADINNMGSSRYGGAISAAIFLKNFTGDARWAHIDIAGPSRLAEKTDYCPVGASGFGVRLLCDLLDRF